MNNRYDYKEAINWIKTQVNKQNIELNENELEEVIDSYIDFQLDAGVNIFIKDNELLSDCIEETLELSQKPEISNTIKLIKRYY